MPESPVAPEPTVDLTRSAGELAASVRSGEVSSRELVEGALARIEAVDPQLHAFTTLDADRALATADAIGPGDPRPFAGVPIAIKDLFMAVDGIRQAQGSELFGDYTPDFDAALVRRVKEAGFVIVGVTAAPELGILPITEPRRFGPTRNPWDPGRTPGGSSGGSAAAVTAGMVPLAHASDGGGSIRIPAACCGLVGLKPSRGRISHAPMLGDSFLVTDGVLTRTVADTAAMLDLLSGYEIGDATWAPPPGEPFAAAAQREPGRLRVGWSSLPPLPTEVDPACTAAVHETAELLESLGHEVEEVDPPYVLPDLLATFTVLWAAMIGGSVALGGAVAGHEPREEDVERLTWALYQQARKIDAVTFVGALTQLQAFARGFITWMEPYDVLMTPSLAKRPLPIGTLDPMAEDPMATFGASGHFTPWTAAFNVTGQPAISLPLHHGDDGLPTGVHFVGPPAGDATLLALAGQLEQARPWADRRPPL